MKKMLVLIFIILGLPAWVFAGDIDSPGVPSAGSGMYTLQQLYNYLNLGTEPPIPGSFQEPSAGPGPTMKTTTNIYDDTKAKFDQCDAQASDVAAGKKFFSTEDGSWGVQTGTGGGGSSAAVPKTGQTTSYAAGDDGDLVKGVAWPNPRFTDNSNGTVTDNLTGLIWLKNANCFGAKSWLIALSDCSNLANGSCGLLDESSVGDWRLPNVRELHSLIGYGFYGPALSNAAGTAQWVEGNPFTAVQSNYYWSSTTYSVNTGIAWFVYLGSGDVGVNNKDGTFYVWPVR